MKLICGYCRKEITADAKPRLCPHCGRIVIMPGLLDPPRIQSGSGSRRRPGRERARRAVAVNLSEFISERRPVIALGLLGLMLAVSGIFMARFSFPTSQMTIVQRRFQTAQNELTVLRIALERFRRDCGRYPRTSEGLLALVNDPGVEGWGGYYITHLRPDPWRTRYVYRSDGQTFALFSCGPDGEEGTEDDISPPDLSAAELAAYLSSDKPGVKTRAGSQPASPGKLDEKVDLGPP